MRSLSSWTKTASVLNPVLNLISSKACKLVGSDTARKSRFPLLNRGNVWCFCKSLESTSFWGIVSGLSADKSNIGEPNSSEAAAAIFWAEMPWVLISSLINEDLFFFELFSASLAVPSFIKASATNLDHIKEYRCQEIANQHLQF